MKRNLFYSILISCLLCLSAPLVLARQDASADLSELSSGSASQEDEPLTVDSVDPLKRDHSSDPQKIPGDKKVPSADSELLIDGDISFRLTHKTAKYQDQSASDQDVYSKLRLDIFSGRHNDYEFHFLGAFRKDLDENQDQTGFYPFENIVDTRKDQLHQVFEAHLDLKWLSSFSLIRLGRQAGNRGEWIYFDGAYFNWDLAEPVKLIFYGGSAVHFFEKNPGDDYLAGLGLDYHPFNHTAVNFDYLTVKDQRQNPVNEGDQKDNLFSVNLNQRFSPLTKGLVKLRWVNGEQRDLKIRAITQELPLGFELNFNYFRQFLSQSALSSETALFYDILGVSNPYQAFDFKLRQVFDKDCALDLGFYRRSLLRAEDESAFNRNFQKTFAVF
ncbi:MAG: hypothetical protein OEY59_13090, partial [Deltaproteobacteria bacterium]|nr:hypothetical protein [Deltaproteobacteria bacterium]